MRTLFHKSALLALLLVSAAVQPTPGQDIPAQLKDREIAQAEAAAYATPRSFSAYADVRAAAVQVSMIAGSASLDVATRLFSAQDVGKIIIVPRTGSPAVDGTIYQIDLSDKGDDYDSVPSVVIRAAAGREAIASARMGVSTAKVASRGRECTNGTQTLTVIGGNGDPAHLSVIVTNGVATVISTIVENGAYSQMPPKDGVAATGGDCLTSPTFDLTYNVSNIIVHDGGVQYPTSPGAVTVSLSGGDPKHPALPRPALVNNNAAAFVAEITRVDSPTRVSLSRPALSTIRTVEQIVWGHDDTKSFERALNDRKAVFVPPGNYLVGNVRIPNGASLFGHAGIGYAGEIALGPPQKSWQTPTSASPTLVGIPGSANILNVTNSAAISLEGLFLDCGDAGSGGSRSMDGISGGSIRAEIKRVTVVRCDHGIGSESGSDTYTRIATIIGSEFANNRIGIGRLIDSAVIGGAVSANHIGVEIAAGSNATNFIGFRVEWNEADGISCYKAGFLQIIGGLIDRNGRSGMRLVDCEKVTMSGVAFYRNGSHDTGETSGDSHIVVTNSSAIMMNGIISATGTNDDRSGSTSPRYFIKFEGNDNKNVTIAASDGTGFTKAFSVGEPPRNYVVRDVNGVP